MRLCAISPLIWRRILLRSDTSIALLHHIIQLAFGWSDSHLHRLVIHGKAYGIAYLGGISFSDDPQQVRLADFCFRPNERFTYDYDFHDLWRHEIRLEQILPFDPTQAYPVCTAGARAAPPEECGGPQAFLALRQHFCIFHIVERLLALLEGDDEVDDPQTELETRHRRLQQKHLRNLVVYLAEGRSAQARKVRECYKTRSLQALFDVSRVTIKRYTK